MKKIISLITVMILLLVMLTGCMNVNYEVSINKDGTADISYVYGFEKEYLEEMETNGEEMTKDMQENAELEEYTIEAYSDDKIEGFKAMKHVENLSEISLAEAFGEENIKDSEENQIKVEKKALKQVYSQNAKIDLTSMEASMASYISMKYTVKLPIKAEKNNADEVSKDGKTLTWNLKAGEIKDIEFKATEEGIIVKIIELIAIIVIAAIILIVIAVIVKKSKNKKQQEDVITSDDKNESVIDNNNETEQIEDKLNEPEITEENSPDIAQPEEKSEDTDTKKDE